MSSMVDDVKPPKRPQGSWLPKWPKGVSGNPGGCPGGVLTKARVKSLMTRFWTMKADEIAAIMTDPNATVGERIVASIALHAIKDGDAARTEWMLMRVVGKVKDELEVSTPKPFIAQYRDGTTEVMGVEEPKTLPEGTEEKE